MTPDLVDTARENEDLTRDELSNLLGITGYKVRQLRREVTNKPVGPTHAVFDLETTDLKGDFGRLLCGSVLSYPWDGMKTFRIEDYNDGKLTLDGPLAVVIRDYIEEHQFSIGYYSKGFDIPFLNTRLLAAGERKMKSIFHYDCIWGYKGWRGVKLSGSSMKTVARYLGIEQKMDVNPAVWVEAKAGDREAIDIIVDRCESDVRITMEIYMHSLTNGLMKNIGWYP
jgi:uncharacterized protein YprB with RNaseH-like and TPR domain